MPGRNNFWLIFFHENCPGNHEAAGSLRQASGGGSVGLAKVRGGVPFPDGAGWLPAFADDYRGRQV